MEPGQFGENIIFLMFDDFAKFGMCCNIYGDILIFGGHGGILCGMASCLLKVSSRTDAWRPHSRKSCFFCPRSEWGIFTINKLSTFFYPGGCSSSFKFWENHSSFRKYEDGILYYALLGNPLLITIKHMYTHSIRPNHNDIIRKTCILPIWH